MSSRAINSIATVCGCCVDVHIIYFLASEKKQTAGKHIAKVQTASIRCVENPLSVKLFAQGQQRWQRGQNENENENDSGERASRRVGQNKPIPKIYIYIYMYTAQTPFGCQMCWKISCCSRVVRGKNLRGHFCAKKRATLFFNGSLGAFMT